MEPSKEIERSCKTCKHTPDGFLDDVPRMCWDCTSHTAKVFWEPREPQAEQLEAKVLDAPSILQNASEVLRQRGEARDVSGSERSMQTIVNIFNAATGSSMTEEQGWKFMLCVKLGRMQGGSFHFDDYVDLVGYSALLAECAGTKQLKEKGLL